MTKKTETSTPNNRAILAREFDALPDNGLTDTVQVAGFLCCSHAKLERDRWSGTGIPFLKVGRLVRYKKNAVLEYLERQSRTSTTETE